MLPGKRLDASMARTIAQLAYKFAVFYVDGNEDHCIPILALSSVLEDERFGDWVSVAFERMQTFCLPCNRARSAIVIKRELE
jgi:UDP-2,3-diacylglucosamine pyrophosphatase LpxH